jgi:hypothetical protein
MRDDFAGGAPHNGSGCYHRSLRAGDVLLESFRAAPRFLLQSNKPHVDAQQRLGNLALESLADRFAVFFLCRQNLVGQPTQTFLELERLVQTLLMYQPPFLVGLLHGFATGNPLLALAAGDGEFLGAPLQSSFQPDEVSLRAPRRALMLLDGRIGFGKENPGSPGITRFCPGQRSRQQEGGDCSFVDAGEVERLQAEGYGSAAYSVTRFRGGVTVLAQVFAQRGHINSGQPDRGLFHVGPPNVAQLAGLAL